MQLNSITDALKKAPVLVSTVVALLAILTWFGFKVQMPGDRLDKHVQDAERVHTELVTRQDSAHAHDEVMQELLEGMARGECIENPKEDLARQGLLTTCRKLGIDR